MITKCWKRWSKTDLNVLEKSAGVMPVSSICKKLRRSEYSVRNKAKLMGLDLTVITPYWFTLQQTAKAIGVSHETVRSWINKGLLPRWQTGFYRRKFLTIQQIEFFFYTYRHKLPSLDGLEWSVIEHKLTEQ